ncbi:uncharacterized protein LOC122248307 [Penaeus japonicus]|uniref:uncharacterized protein LOC122248307 n=1 Tax=Penaeus japonicus TaxID=27405 RepID=UPI001C70FEEA|nr:uncharacterized protein LOC122248307 [Penaeus japonicus]
MKAFGLLVLFVGAAVAKSTRGNAAYTYTYSETGLGGFYQLFTDYAPDLLNFNFDNAIKSVYQTGMWLYYENVQYNQQSGKVYWVHGIEISVDFPQDNWNMCSSLKFVGSPDYMNVDTWTVYEGPIFTGSEYYGEADAGTLGSITDQGSSIILTGTSPWTFYDGTNWTGASMCVYPNTDQDVGSAGQVLNFGIYPNVSERPRYNRQQHRLGTKGVLVRERGQCRTTQGRVQRQERSLGSPGTLGTCNRMDVW